MRVLPFVCAAGMALTCAMSALAQPAFSPPATPARPVVETLHGVTLTDRYRWLENGKDAEVERWTRTQHAATRRGSRSTRRPCPACAASSNA